MRRRLNGSNSSPGMTFTSIAEENYCVFLMVVTCTDGKLS